MFLRGFRKGLTLRSMELVLARVVSLKLWVNLGMEGEMTNEEMRRRGARSNNSGSLGTDTGCHVFQGELGWSGSRFGLAGSGRGK